MGFPTTFESAAASLPSRAASGSIVERGSKRKASGDSIMISVGTRRPKV